MNGKDLFIELGNISPKYYEEAENGGLKNMKSQKKTRTFKGTAGKILIAAAIIMALAVTASAAGLGWFQRYFEEKNDKPLTPAEVEYIEQNEQTIEKSETQDGYTLKVKSAITDGRMAYVTIGVTAPENVELENPHSTGIPLYVGVGNWPMGVFEPASGEPMMGAMSLGTEADNDGRNNTQDWLLIAERDPAQADQLAFASGSAWKLHIEDLVATYRDEAYQKELDQKYEGRENFMYTDEEAEKLYKQVTLAKGVWDFDITFEDCDTRAVELVKDPITTKACVAMKLDGSDVYGDMNITSFKLSALSATILTDDPGCAPDFTSARNQKFIYAVMKDGSRVQLRAGSGSPGEQQLEAVRPIILDNVDYVLLTDGTKLPMP